MYKQSCLSWVIALFFFTTALNLLSEPATAAVSNNEQSDSPPIPSPCAHHLTRTPDATIAMGPNKKEAEVTVNVPATPAQIDLPGRCTRWVVQISMPANASSGCSNCYPWAEINAGLAQFPNSKEFEEHFYRPKDSAGEDFCKSYRHDVSVYKKPNGATAFNTKPLRSFSYRGHWENNTCKVRATYLGQVHDTSEVYAPVNKPTSGTDVYRVLHLGRVDGTYQKVKVLVEYEPQRR